MDFFRSAVSTTDRSGNLNQAFRKSGCLTNQTQESRGTLQRLSVNIVPPTVQLRTEVLGCRITFCLMVVFSKPTVFKTEC